MAETLTSNSFTSWGGTEETSKCSLADGKRCAWEQRRMGAGQLRGLPCQPRCHRSPGERTLSGNLKEVVWSEKKSKEAGVAEQNAEGEGRGDKELGTVQGQLCISDRNSGLTLKGMRRHS